MGKSRLEAFSDGVIAIIITIMVLEFKVPHGNQLIDLKPLIPVLISYVLSFMYVGIYWNNHHHLLHPVSKINGSVLWANHFLLFWLSVIPFVTSWMGENNFSRWPVFLYGLVLLMNSISFGLLVSSLLKAQGDDLRLKKILGSDNKGKASTFLYFIALIIAFFIPMLSLGIYLLVAIIWFIPDSRIEKALSKDSYK